MGLSKELATDYATRFQEAATMTVARLMRKENPEVYASVEAARTALRAVRGALGKRMRGVRERSGDPALFREKGDPHVSPWELLPEPIGDFSEARPFHVPESRILVLADIHFPFHDRAALIAALDYGKAWGPDAIILNGDILDCHTISRFVTDPRLRDFGKEIEQTKVFLQVLRKEFPDARVYMKRGNHELRYSHYMFTRAPELLGISEMFELPNILGLEALGISWHEEREYLQVGRLSVVHGHEFGKGGGVNAARWLYLKAGATTMCGHFHRIDAHSDRRMDGKVTSTWATGCLCGMSPDYAIFNKWAHGFATIESDGYNFRVENLRIIEGRVY